MTTFDNYQAVRARISAACARAGRNPEEVELICVSKTWPADAIAELAAQGVRAFGENKVQELAEKRAALSQKLEWHMIGHLQRNKVAKLLSGPVALIHSVDSLRLAEEISRQATKQNIIVPVLVEVNIGREESKSGVMPQAARELAYAISALPNLKLKGLMCVAPAVSEPELARPYFKELRTLRDELQNGLADCKGLSMGMSGDFEVAIEEGATYVRVGSAIFGQRNYDLKA